MDILFWIHRSKSNRKGEAPLKIRVTCGIGDRVEISTGKFVNPDQWNVDKKRVIGKSVQADIINRYIVASENKLIKIESDLQLNDLPISAEIIRNIFLGNHIQRYGLLQVLDIHNDLFRQKIGQKGFSQSTLDKYTGALRRKIEYFIESKYKRKDIYISELNLDFIESFWHFLTTKGKEVKGKFTEPMDVESACGIISKFKKIAKIGFRKQEIAINPFDDFKVSFSKESKVPLTIDEVNEIMNKEFSTTRLDRVRDRFIIGCFTGMANEDIQTVTKDMVSIDVTGKKWIDRGRTKTGELCIIPLWDPVIKIIEKYKDDPSCKEGGYLFPRISLQKMNEYLHEIALICGIKKKLTTHICRHTFADIYLNSGGSIDNLARILGHSNIRTTSGYAKRNKTTITKESINVEQRIFGYMDKINERKTS
jgi:integrase